jgi:Transcriptional regulator
LLTDSVYGVILSCINRIGRKGDVDLEKFLNLPEEKQIVIIDSALKIFGANGYKKASISEIAAEAGISKAMVFHYFGTKKELYLYLFHYCSQLILDEIDEKFDNSITDFFDRIYYASEIKLSVMKKHPSIISFITGAYFESSAEVAGDIKKLLDQGEDLRNKMVFDKIDISKFKEGVDVKLVMKMLVWMAEGIANNSKNSGALDIDQVCREFYQCMNLLKTNLYQ